MGLDYLQQTPYLSPYLTPYFNSSIQIVQNSVIYIRRPYTYP
jgi:hypothetical protein